jgi:hypothetical protein
MTISPAEVSNRTLIIAGYAAKSVNHVKSFKYCLFLNFIVVLNLL